MIKWKIIQSIHPLSKDIAYNMNRLKRNTDLLYLKEYYKEYFEKYSFNKTYLRELEDNNND